MRNLDEPSFEEPVRITGAGGANRFVFLRTVGEAIDYVDQALAKNVGPVDLLKRAHLDLRSANDSGRSEDVANARKSLVIALAAIKVLVKNSVTGRA